MEIRIQFDPATGKIGLSGQMDNAVMALGMLDMAREIIHRNMREAQGPRIMPAPIDLTKLRNGR